MISVWCNPLGKRHPLLSVASHRHSLPFITFPTRVPFLLIAGISKLQEHADGMSQLKARGGKRPPVSAPARCPLALNPRPSTSPNPTLPSPCILWRETVIRQPLRSRPGTSSFLLYLGDPLPHRPGGDPPTGPRPRSAASTSLSQRPGWRGATHPADIPVTQNHRLGRHFGRS